VGGWLVGWLVGRLGACQQGLVNALDVCCLFERRCLLCRYQSGLDLSTTTYGERVAGWLHPFRCQRLVPQPLLTNQR
jgi:hypothetical protein